MDICPKCKSEISIKDNERFSSALCKCRIVIYYYEIGNHIEISKEEYIAYKKSNKMSTGDKHEALQNRTEEQSK